MTIRTFSLVLAGAVTAFSQPQVGGFHGMQYEVVGRKVLDRQVKGSPYAAQEITESTQTLADGSHIKSSATSQVYRDVEGRVRMERTFGKAGTATQKTMITIVDPVAGVQYQIDPQAKTARKMVFQARAYTASTAGSSQATPEAKKGRPDGRAALGVLGGVPGGVAGNAQPAVESLGHQIFDGVDATGTRTTFTIPAGAIGNEAAIQVVNERWYSRDLQTTIMSRHSDPRSGETVFRLANISRSNPDSSLFQVPSDVQVTESARPFPGHRGLPPQ